MINARSRVLSPMSSSNQIVFFDTTLRDGEQSPGCTMHHAEKLRMAHQLAALGVDILEAGFAIASDGASASDLHLAAKLKIPREQALDQIAESVALARSYAEDVEFSPEDATRTDPDFLVKVCEVAIEAGATTLNLPDTVGYCIPQDYAAMFRMVRAR